MNIFPAGWTLCTNQGEKRINLGLMINAGMLVSSSKRLSFGKPVITLGLTGKSLSCCQVRANETYSEAKCQLGDRNRDVCMNVQSPHQWWSILKSTEFGSSLSLPPLAGGTGGLVCESVGKTDLLSDHFDTKQSREAVDLSLTYHPSPNFTTFSFRSSEVRHLLLDFEAYSGTDPLGMFPLFLRELLMLWPPVLV